MMRVDCQEVFRIRLQHLLTKNNMSQSVLAQAIGVTVGAISNYNTGVRTPSIDTLIKMSEVFGCGIDFLVGIKKQK